MNDPMSWIDKRQEEIDEAKSEMFFKIVEGDNRIQLLSYIAPLPQVWDNAEKKYRVASEGDTNISIKGVCWVLQDGKIKEAKLPYSVTKAIRDLQVDPDYAFEGFPMPRLINIKAKNAGSKEVEYTVIPSPKETQVSSEILVELEGKQAPEAIVERIRGKSMPVIQVDEVASDSIPF